MSELQLKAGKHYRTNAGQKVFLGYTNAYGCFVGHHVESKHLAHVWHPNGCSTIREHRDLDLISEWKEPRKGEVWVSIHYSESAGLHVRAFDVEDKTGAFVRCLDRIALLGPIPWTEGQGLPDNGSGE